MKIAREATEAFNEGKISPHFAPDVIVTPPPGWPDAGEEIRGAEAWARQVERLRDSWESPRVEIDDLRPIGADRVLALFRYVTTGRDSGISFETPMGGVFTIKSGKIVRAEYFRSPAEALAAAGLSE